MSNILEPVTTNEAIATAGQYQHALGAGNSEPDWSF